MPFEKGHKKIGGKQVGAQNKDNRELRQALTLLAVAYKHKPKQWIDLIAKKDPEKALRLFIDLIEYVIPKLARQELTGKDGEDLIPRVPLTPDQAKAFLNKVENGC